MITKSNFKHNFIIRLFTDFVNGETKKVLYRNSSGYSYFLCVDIPTCPKHIVLGYLQKYKDFGMIVLSNNKGVSTYEFLDTY